MASFKEREPGWNCVKSKQEVVNVQSGGGIYLDIYIFIFIYVSLGMFSKKGELLYHKGNFGGGLRVYWMVQKNFWGFSARLLFLS
jgi:hypothetical protein